MALMKMTLRRKWGKTREVVEEMTLHCLEGRGEKAFVLF